MEQRPLRVGDLVDDYCPRERRVTNHAIVAIVGDVIRQTRCTTCDAEHAYKAAKTPRRRKPDTTTALYDEVLAGVTGGQLVAPGSDEGETIEVTAEVRVEALPPPAATNGVNHEPVVTASEAPDDGHRDGWTAHRPLIRATLPRTENDTPTPRPIPEFTMHQRNVRGSHSFRQQGQGWQDRGPGGGGGGGRNGFRPGKFGQQGAGPARPGQGGGANRGRHHRKPKPPR